MKSQQPVQMNALHFPLLAGLLCFIGGPTFGNSWLQRTSLPAAARAEPMSFGLNGQVYLVGGQHPAAGSAILLADCWAYDPITNSWSQKADYGGGQISTGVAFSIGSFGFVGSGAVFPGGQLWAYNPTANQWTQKASIPLGSPGLQRVSSAAFTVADKAYVCGGSDGAGYHSDLWEYDPATDTWTQRTSFPGGGRWGAIAFSANGKGYFGTGASWLNEHQDMWSYDPQNDTWVQVGNFPGGVRSYAAAFGIGTRGFVHGGKHGSGSIYNDLWEFNALNDTWTQRASNLNRYTAAATSLGDKGYFGMGLLDTGSFGTFFNDWWEYTPDPQLDCLGVPNGTALPGTSCDDGNASTTNDVLGSNCICAGTPSTNSWVQRADFGGGQRGGGFSFALAGKGFVGGGSNSGGTSFNDHWAYDPTTNTWSQMASLPVTGATGGLGFSIGGNGYVYVTEVNALWAYDPNTNSWIERAAFPGGPRFRPFGFALDAYGYMGGGFSYGPWASMNDFWRYDPSSDSWLQRADLSGVARSGSASFTVDGLGYVFGGADDAFNVLGDLQAYDPVANSWNSRSPLPSIGRRGATGFSIGHAGYVAGGSTSSFIRLNECWEYQPGNNLWNAVAAPGPEGREVGMAFTIGMQGYLVGGYAGGANTTFADMRMYTQNPQPDCNGVVGGTNYPGTPCDDGNATTTNDVFDANCMCTGTNAPDAWVQRADFGGGQRAGGFSFTLAGAGYVGGGNMNEVTPTSDVWAFDPLTNAWSQVASLPVTANAGSLGFTIGSNGYVFAAQGNDLWAYDPVGNAWSARTTLPASGRFRPFGFALGAYGYVGGGRYGSTSLSDFWRYDPVSDAWLQRADIPGPARWVGASFAVDGIGYIFGGADDAFNDLNDLQAFNPATNTWSPRAPMPGTARRAASGFSIGHAGYVAGGSTAGNLRFNECWEYQPGNNLWNQVADPGPEARSSAMAFTIGDHGYVVGGFTGDATTLTADMRMYTQNPQPDCNGVIGGTNYPGTPCDDGLAYTGNDALNGLCICQGTCVNDADGDGICDEVDSCPSTPGIVGGACDDGNPCTLLDVVDGNCQCTGSYSDSDSDGICDTQDNCPSTPGQQGSVCDDGNPSTINDVVGTTCVCEGTQIPNEGVWIQRAPFPGFPRQGAASFSIGTDGYICTGLADAGAQSDLWRYDANANSWSQQADFPGIARVGAVAFAVNGMGYVGTGNAAVPTGFVKDFYAYDPVQNTWAQKPDFGNGLPHIARGYGVGFAIGGKGYIGLGYGEYVNNSEDGTAPKGDLWSYDPTTEQWTQLAGFPTGGRWFATAFVCNDRAYVGSGEGGFAQVNTDLYAYDPATDTWTGKAPMPGFGVNQAVAFSIGNFGYVGSGNWSGPLQDFYRYDALQDTWTTSAALTGPARMSAIAFALNGKGYVSTGWGGLGVELLGDTWEFTPGNSCTVGAPCDDGDANTTNDVITAACTCAGTPSSSEAWTQQADFSGFPRANAIAFTIGSYGYMGTGEDATSLFQDLWRYDATSDSWSQMADIDVPRTGAYAFAIGDFGYVGDGNDQNALHIADLRRYDPASNSWTWLFAFSPGGQGRYRAVAFSANGKGYMGSGQNTFGPTDDFWEFDPVTFNWAQMPNMPGGQRSLATAFAIGNKGYAGTGSSGPGVVLNDFYEFDALTLTWSPKSNFGGTARGSAVSFALASKGYIGTGQDGSGTLQDFWEYDPTADTWTQRAPLPGPQRLAASAFTVDGRAYVSMGSNSNGVLGDVWEYTPAGVTCTVGAPCDDGLAYTQNDTLTANCSCAGACISDLDLDGLCDEVDPCPYQSLPVGSACDDFNACTENDVVQPWCGCAGTPLPDGDSDGICDLLDQCPSSPGSIGYACDDGNPCTANDVIDANCVCAGQIPDANNDGLSDLCNPYVMQTATSGCSTYMLLSQSNWTNAEAAAVALGGHLATINDASENNFIFTTFSNNLSVDRGLWIGLNDATNEGQFEWSSGEPVTYSQWAPGEPNNDDGNEDYVHLFWQSVPVAASWNDYKYDAIAFDGIPIHGVVEIPTVDTDNDGICDLQDNCPTIPGMIGSTCDDGNACTLNDVLDANCQCIGTPLICDDGNVCNGVETCVAGVCVAGIALNCDDGNPCTINSCDPLLGCTQLNVPDGTSCGVNTQCLSGVCTPIIACDTWTLEFATDNTGSESTWQIINANTLAVIGSGGPYASTTTTTASVCIPASACYRLRVTDANGMSNGTTGGFVLRDNTGKRVLDNANDGVFTGISQAVAPFCSPVGNDGLIASQCDKVDWLPGGLLIASQNSAVSAQYGVGNQSDDGYEFRIFNPDGGYDRTVFISHANPVPGAATGATAACYLGFSSLQTNPVPQNVLLNVRVRSAVNGVFSAWGPACRFKIDATSANCPTTKLITTPGSTFSCGATGKVVNASGASGRIYAQPVTRPVGGVNQAANAYLFELTNTANNYIRVIGTSSYTLVLGKWYTDPLLCGTHTYTVRVRVSFDGGATYCPWGASCTVGITNNFTSPFCTTPAGNLCGNGVMNPGETCDDGNQVNGDGCDNNCQPTGSATAYNTDRVFFDGDGNDTSSELNLWPNPNDTEQLHVTINALNAEVTTATVDIFDLVGHKVGTHTIPVNGSTLNTVIALDASMANGMYLVNVTAGDQTFVQRLVIQ